MCMEYFSDAPNVTKNVLRTVGKIIHYSGGTIMENFLSKKIFKHKPCQFAVIDEKCYFCDHPITVLFNEHYNFCPDCSAIYTFPTVHKTDCSHIRDNIPVAERPPWYKEYRDAKPYIYEESSVFKRHSLYEEIEGVTQKCSICHAECTADSW